MPKPPPSPVRLPQGTEPIPATPIDKIELILQKLHDRKAAWVQTSTQERAMLLRKTITTTVQVMKTAATVSTHAKGVYGGGIGEEYFAWTPIVTCLRELAEAMDCNGAPKPHSLTQRPNGQFVADVMPLGLEGIFFGGWKGEVWIQKGKPASQGAVYRNPPSSGHISLVLGAGNQAAVGATDILNEMFAKSAVVVCKMNPVNEYLGPYLRQAFAPLVDAGFMEIVYGGPTEGEMLCTHPLVSSIHLTGSAATYDAIVWGPNNPNKTGAPKNKKHVTAELGCVTPYLITPGQWSQSDIEYVASGIAGTLSHNAGHNCVKPELIITAKQWPQREAFVQALRKALAEAPCRAAYYPGSEKRAAAFCKSFGKVEALGNPNFAENCDEAKVQAMPFLFQAGLSPKEACLDVENWCGVLQEVAIPDCGSDPVAFLKQATLMANGSCWGTLSCSLYVPPDVQRAHADAVEGAVAGLKYGSVSVNCPSICGFPATRLSWGAFPGHTQQDIQTGNTVVHNTMLFDHVEKSVLRVPWRWHPTPYWLTKNRNLEGLALAAAPFFASPGFLTLVPAAIAALRC
ncbi:hypothetical protein WJX84_011056 [Apatococcus fuscideae]|uniref:Aldehyde dehydrogenase domain-containing protein n=1 Tax=Apatococcus fuscideae TaxID=2026836 RepID=A0AAW1TDW7_9CHLO